MKTIFRSPLWRLLLLLPFASNAAPPDLPQWNLTLTTSEWVAPNIIRIPFTLTGTLITVRARLDTLEGNFFFDTGASGLLLNHRYMSKQTGSASVSGGGVTGKVRVLGASKIDTFLLDNMQVVDVPAEWIDMSHIERSKKIGLIGIIGYRVFEGFEVLFDYEASRLVLIRTNAKGNPIEALPNWEYQLLDSLSVVTAGHVAIIRLEFGHHSKKSFALDSGAEQNLLSATAGKRFLKEHFDIRKRVKLNGAGKESIEVLSGQLLHAHIDSFHLKPMNTLLINMSEINETYQTQVDGVLGYEFLSQRPVSINYKKRRVRFYSKSRP
jgi:hypothetical protein